MENVQRKRESYVRLKKKLKKLKNDLTPWNKEVFGVTSMKKQTIIRKIDEIDKLDDERDLEEDTRLLHMKLLSDLKLIYNKENSILYQKARVNWLEQGDTNSKYFHSRIRWRRIKNELKGVEIQGGWCEDPTKVKETVKEFFFQNKFSASTHNRITLDNIDFPSLTPADNNALINNIEEVEIKEAVNQCGSDKSPGPDGFNFNFIKNNWQTMKQDIIQAVNCFQQLGEIPRGCNAPFITLIPKKNNPID